jgi:hypothetical protein
MPRRRHDSRHPFTYANVVSTLAVFLAIGGGAWAASGGFVSSKGTIAACVALRGGAVRIVPVHAHCKRAELPVALAHAQAGPVRGPMGPPGSAGPTGPPGPAGPGGYSIQIYVGGQVTFAGNHIRLKCEEPGHCTAQVAMGGSGLLAGSDERGTSNGAITTSKTVYAETPATVDVTSITGKGTQSRSHATVWLEDGTGWSIDLELFTESLGNARLIGTAIPVTRAVCVGYIPPGPPCHLLPSSG